MTLNPCPYCGSTDVHVTLYNHPSVVCHTCWAIGPKGPRLSGLVETDIAKVSVQEAVRSAHELWNKRAGPSVTYDKLWAGSWPLK